MGSGEWAGPLVMIDVHSHLLPGVDDGSRSAEQSVEVLSLLAAQGVTDVVLTPHVRASEIAADGVGAVAWRTEAFDRLRAVHAGAPELHLGFEIMLDLPLPDVVVGDRRFSLAGSRYFLVEFPYSVVPDFAVAVLGQIAEAGAIPLVAHAERYEGCLPAAVGVWREVGAKVQVDATTLTKPTDRGHRARQLIAQGLADIIAGDNHGNSRSIKTGVEYLEKRGAARQARLLANRNPAAILDDGDMVDVPAVVLREGVLERWKRFVGG